MFCPGERYPRIRRVRSFTLVEVLVAMAMVVLILGALYASYAAATESATRCRKKISFESDVRILFARLTSELRCAYLRPRRGPSRPAGSIPISRKAGSADFVGRRDPADGVAVGFLVEREADGLRRVRPGVRRVAYGFDRADRVLLRQETPPFRKVAVGLGEPVWVQLARNVASVVFRYHDGKEWREEWNSDEEHGLPRAVSIEVAFDRDDDEPVVFRTATWLSGGRSGSGEAIVRTTIKAPAVD